MPHKPVSFHLHYPIRLVFYSSSELSLYNSGTTPVTSSECVGAIPRPPE